MATTLVVSGANAAAPTVLLSLSVTGTGSVKVSNEPSVRCTGTCQMTFRIKAGSKVTVLPKPSALWKLAPWTGACHGARTSCALRLTKPQRVAVTFVTPGAETNPLPLGTPWFVSGNWLLDVSSVTPNANGQVMSPDGTTQPVPAGAQFFMLDISATYKGSGSASFGDLANELAAIGHAKTAYGFNSGNGCGPGRSMLPSHDIQPKVVANSPVLSNQTVSGMICFQVAAGDATSLMLSVGRTASPKQRVFFALH